MIALAAIAILAQAAAFAPPLGVPLRVVTERIQDDDLGRREFRIERLVRFARDGIGYRAEVRLVSAHADAPAATAAMFEAGFSGLAGKTMVFRLDGAGRVVSVDGLAALWEAFCEGVARIAAARHAGSAADRADLARQIAAPLRAFAPARQIEALGSLVDVLVSHDPPEPPGERAVRMPASSPFGGSVMLAGRRRIGPDGPLILSDTRAEGDIDVPARAGEPPRSGHVETEVTREIDPATGLFVTVSESVETRVGEGAAERRTSRVSTIHVDPLPASAWIG